MGGRMREGPYRIINDNKDKNLQLNTVSTQLSPFFSPLLIWNLDGIVV